MIWLFLIGIAAAAGAIVVMSRKRAAPRPVAGRPLSELGSAGAWIIANSHGMPRHLKQETKGWSFDFPQQPTPKRTGPSVHYLQFPFRGTIGGTLMLSFEISGDGTLDAADGGGTPGLWLWFQRFGDDYSAKGNLAYYRWWSRQGAPLTPGEHVLTVPLDYEAWGPVLSTNHSEAERRELFAQAKAAPVYIGFTLGGGGGKGHGVYCKSGSGAVRFHLKEFVLRQ